MMKITTTLSALAIIASIVVLPSSASAQYAAGGGFVVPVSVPDVAPTGFSGGGSVSSASTGSTGGKVLGAATFNFNNNLHIGMKNDEVKQLQIRLATEGFFKANPTGYFGTVTFAAVKAYQTAHNITPATGFVGPLTRTALNS